MRGMLTSDDTFHIPAKVLIADAREWVSDCVEIPGYVTTRQVFQWIDQNYDGNLDGYCDATYGRKWGAYARDEIRAGWNI